MTKTYAYTQNMLQQNSERKTNNIDPPYQTFPFKNLFRCNERMVLNRVILLQVDRLNVGS